MRATVLSLCFSLSLGGPFLGVLKAQQGDVQAGAKLHQQECARCHGPEGKGNGPAGKLLKVKPADWTDPTRMAALSEDHLLTVIKQGGKVAGLSTQMPDFGSKLSDAKVRDLIAFIKSVREEAPAVPAP